MGQLFVKSPQPGVHTSTPESDDTEKQPREQTSTPESDDKEKQPREQTSTDASESDDNLEKETILFLLGKTGVGKSATANTIIGDDRFESSDCAQSVTAAIQVEWARRLGRIIKVVDGPGLFDTKLEKGEAAKKMAKDTLAAFMLCPDGFHSLLLVFKYGNRFTDEEQRTVNALKGIFGQNFVRDYCTIVLTCGDSFDVNNRKTPKRTFQDWCHQQEGEMQKLFEECQYRVFLFHNLEPEKQESDLEAMLNTVDNLRSRGTPYTSEIFQQAAPTRNLFVVKENAPLLREKILRKLDLLVQGINKMKDGEGELEDLKNLLNVVIADAESLLKEIRRDDMNTGVLATMEKTVFKISESLIEIKTANVSTVIALKEKLAVIDPLQTELMEECSMAKKVLIGSVIVAVTGLLAAPLAFAGSAVAAAGGAAAAVATALEAAGIVAAGTSVAGTLSAAVSSRILVACPVVQSMHDNLSRIWGYKEKAPTSV